MRRKRIAALLMLAMLGSGAHAETGDYVPLPNLVSEQDGVMYATGGVGEEERSILKSIESEFNLRILTTLADGAYVGQYAVAIKDTQGKTIMEANGDGPWFMVQLPAGRYVVEESHDDKTESQRVTLGASGWRQLVFRWK